MCYPILYLGTGDPNLWPRVDVNPAVGLPTYAAADRIGYTDDERPALFTVT